MSHFETNTRDLAKSVRVHEFQNMWLLNSQQGCLISWFVAAPGKFAEDFAGGYPAGGCVSKVIFHLYAQVHSQMRA
jgi:hypothetical protein